MSESARKKQRVTPSRPEGPGANDGTPHADLQRLTDVIPKPITPYRRASSAGATPGSRRTPNFPIRTPGTGRTPRGGPATRPIPSRRVAPTTPHAIRALRERAHAARTPGHNRRRSGRIQRETPRDILRDLSRALARDTRPIEPSPQIQTRPPRHSALDLPDVEDGPDPTAPRLSMPLEDMYDDDSFHEAPPRQSLLPNLPDDVDNGTIQSLEFGRRALSEDPRMAGRVSERFADLNELGMDGEDYEVDGTFITRRPGFGMDQLLEEAIDNALDETTTLQALTGRRDARPSDVDLGVFGELDDETEEPTFRFTIPPRMQAPVQEEVQDPTQEELLDEPQLEEDEEGVGVGSDLVVDEETGIIVAEAAPAEPEMTGWESDNDVEQDVDLKAYREEEAAINRSLTTHSPERPASANQRVGRQRRATYRSRRGFECPSFPVAPVKTLASAFLKSQGNNSKLGKDTVAALVEATNFFFEDISEDLAAYSQHAGRKVIEESDVIAVMKRTRQITSNSTSFSLAQKMLPRELLQQLRMEPIPKLKKPRQKRKRMETIEEEEEAG